MKCMALVRKNPRVWLADLGIVHPRCYLGRRISLSQKKLIDTMDPGNLNLNVFLFSAVLTSIPLPFTFQLTGRFSLWSMLSLIGLGFITGLSFYMNAKALKKVSFLTSVIISNTTLLFTLLWSWMFYGESVSGSILFGAVLLVMGIILANIPKKLNQMTRDMNKDM